MRHLLTIAALLACLGLAGCASDGSTDGGRGASGLGVSPITPYQIEGGKGWR